MDDPRLVIVLLALAVTGVLWAAALVMGRVDVRVTARGFRNGALIAAALFGITVAIVTFVFNGRAVFVDTLDLERLGFVERRRPNARAPHPTRKLLKLVLLAWVERIAGQRALAL